MSGGVEPDRSRAASAPTGRRMRALNSSRVDRSNSRAGPYDIGDPHNIGRPHTPSLAEQLDIEGVSRRSDNSAHGYRYHSHGCSTELGSISYSRSGRQRVRLG